MKEESPASLIRRQSVESAQISAWARKLLSQHMKELEKKMNDPLAPDAVRSDCAAELMEIMKSMNDAVYKAAPFLLERGKGQVEGVAVPTAADVMEELTKGRKPK